MDSGRYIIHKYVIIQTPMRNKKILIFSDTHISRRFSQKKFELLENIISDVDQVIINGDLWDDTKTTFDDFVNSPWSKLFPLLKNKNAIYIHGNHDMQHKSDNRVKLFCNKVVVEHEIKLSDKIIKVRDGHDDSPLTRIVYFFFKNSLSRI